LAVAFHSLSQAAYQAFDSEAKIVPSDELSVSSSDHFVYGKRFSSLGLNCANFVFMKTAYSSRQSWTHGVQFLFLATFFAQFLICSEAQAQPVAAYNFNEGMGFTVTDISGNGNNGTVSGTSWTTEGKYGGALVFNGLSWVTVNDSNSLDVTTGMTLEAWVYPTDLPNNWTTVMVKETTGNLIWGLFARSPSFVSANNGPLVNVVTGGLAELYGPAAVPINTWTFLTGTYDAVNGQSLYVNGVQVAHIAASGNIVTSTEPLRMGGNLPFAEYFTGRIDEVRIYNRELTQEEIAADMNTPVGVSPTPTPGVTPTPTPTSTPSPTPAVTPTPTPVASPTPTPTPGPCALNSNYWGRNLSAWCLTSIQLGCTTYTQTQAFAIIRHSSSHDKTYSLAKNLIAARLNIACQETESSCIISALAAADAWVCAHPIGSGVVANSAAWREINQVNTLLEKYNGGRLCAPSCDLTQ